MKNIVYFDLETQKSAEEVGGWHNARLMRMSVGVSFSTARGGYRIYAAGQVAELADELRRADLVVGFNIAQFDYAVLAGEYPFFDAQQVPTLDLLLEVQKSVPHRLSLAALARPTLGLEKSSEGLQAIQWFREGKLLAIAEYCCCDVKITRLLHEYGAAHKQVCYVNRLGRKVAVPVNW
jgi:DEAD/DEAH box helicase domain-containing protein